MSLGIFFKYPGLVLLTHSTFPHALIELSFQLENSLQKQETKILLIMLDANKDRCRGNLGKSTTYDCTF